MSMNFVIGTNAIVKGKPINLNDNEYIRIRAYSANENDTYIHNSSYQMDYCS